MIAASEGTDATLEAESLDPSPFAIGDRVPAQAFAPRDAQAVATLLRRCDEAGAAVVLFGNGTLQSLGNLPERYDVAITCRRLDAVIAYEPRDLTIGVGAGITIAALRERLARDGLFIPLDVPHPAQTTVGGALASGWLGPRRAAYGRPRDLVIGSTAALLDGTLARAGGMVVKNVTGYDMSKLYVGSLGTLGALVAVNFKTLPLPVRVRVAIAPLAEETRDRAIEALGHVAVDPVCALAIDGFPSATPGNDAPARLVVRYEGTEAAVERATREVRSALGAAGVASTRILDRDADAVLEAILDAQIESRADAITFRSSGTPSTTIARARACRPIAATSEIVLETVADLRNGDVAIRFRARDPQALALVAGSLAESARATLSPLTAIAVPPHVRAAVDAWGAPPASFPVMRSIKERFDPQATLAPGRYVGGL